VSLGYDSAGKRRQRSLYGKTRGEVRDKLLDAQRQVKDGIEPPKSTSASVFLEQWLATLRGRRASSTVATYERTVRLYLAPWLRSRPLVSLRPDDLEKFYRELAKRGVGARTIGKAHATLRAALTYALKTEKAARNVASMIEPPAYAPEKKTVLDVAQARVLFAALEGHAGEALFGLAVLTQIREGELLALRWSDVDLDARVINIERSMQDDETGRPQIGKGPKTEAGERPVLLPRRAVRLLRAHRKRTGGEAEELVFASERGTPLRRQNVLQRWLYPVLDRCRCGHPPHDQCQCGHRPHVGAPCETCGCQGTEESPARRAAARNTRRTAAVTFHELRHSGATMLGDRHLRALQQRLGHSSSATTADIYLTLPVEDQKPLADRLDILFGGTNEGIGAQRRPATGKKKPRKT
jgi:integrase